MGKSQRSEAGTNTLRRVAPQPRTLDANGGTTGEVRVHKASRQDHGRGGCVSVCYVGVARVTLSATDTATTVSHQTQYKWHPGHSPSFVRAIIIILPCTHPSCYYTQIPPLS